MKTILPIMAVAAVFVAACGHSPQAPDTSSPANPAAPQSAVPVSGAALDPKVDWSGLGSAPPTGAAHQHGDAPAGTVYTCPMHPEIRQDKPGKCPICGMNLVPAKKEEGHAH